MQTELATGVTTIGGMYDRLQHIAARADISLYKLAEEAGVTRTALYQLKSRAKKGTQTAWKSDTLNTVSKVLADRLGKKPSEVYAYLTDLEETDLSSK